VTQQDPDSAPFSGLPALDPEEWRNATPDTWRSAFGEGNDHILSPECLREEAGEVARRLLGSVFVSELGNGRVEAVVVETEAYPGPHDPASHAAERIGRTRRNHRMFGPPGTAYVYRSYGIHWCLNVVTGSEGYPAAVLIRGVDPMVGRETVRLRRWGREPLCAGPGRVCQALHVTGAQDGHPLHQEPLRLRGGWDIPVERVGVSGRVGVSRAADWPLRFYLPGHPQVTRPGGRVSRPPRSERRDKA